jgi:hypothetical protein
LTQSLKTVANLPTHFGDLDVAWEPGPGAATLRLGGHAAPPQGFLLRPPEAPGAAVSLDAKMIENTRCGLVLPAGTQQARVQLSP